MTTTVITTVLLNRMQARAESHLSSTVPLWRQRKRLFRQGSLFHFQNVAVQLLLLSCRYRS